MRNFMLEEQIIVSRTYAIKDIAYQWFAFFEGETASLEMHSNNFSTDVKLIHAGVLILANEQTDLEYWFKS